MGSARTPLSRETAVPASAAGAGEPAAATNKLVYFFGDGGAEGNGSMKDVLGGKGAGLAEMCHARLRVPPGFTISANACGAYLKLGSLPSHLETEVQQALAHLERIRGQRLGDPDAPLLVSVRSGSKFSMPGMMDTVLNVGLNDSTVKALSRETGNDGFALDSYRRLIQMFGSVVMGVPKSGFEKAITSLTSTGTAEVVERFKTIVRETTGNEFPQDPRRQLWLAIEAVFRSWNGERARHYRRMNKIPEDLGTAVNVQAMVFGNLDENSGTGVAFTRNPATGESKFFGEFLDRAQGEDVVSGARTPIAIEELQQRNPRIYGELLEIATRLEWHFRDVQDFEFTVEKGKLYVLQTRNGKRTGRAAVRIAVDMLNEKMITREQAVMRVSPQQLFEFLVPVLGQEVEEKDVVTVGLPASPGAAVGRLVFDSDEAHRLWEANPSEPLILVRSQTSPEDIHGMEAAAGILTSHGGMTSHAAVVARGMGKCCIVGAERLLVREIEKEASTGDRILRAGDWVTLDGSTGRVIIGRMPLKPPTGDDPTLQTFMRLCGASMRMEVRANADTPTDAVRARGFGATGIGLCRTEHMFFAPARLEAVRRMILASSAEKRKAALAELLPMQRQDFIDIFEVMDGLPVTIRLLDPPLHEFLPKLEEVQSELRSAPKGSSREEELRQTESKIKELHEENPMLGLRGCRVGITIPEITEMQVRAIMEAACEVTKRGKKVIPEIMVPLVGLAEELLRQRELIDKVAARVAHDTGMTIRYCVGTMIEIPRAAFAAGELAKSADFFSFGTNDLTQLTFGYSRDDSAKFLPTYLESKVLVSDPFVTVDVKGVGELVRIAVERGRKANPELELGACGEHAGDPESIAFFESVGLDYVSCSPFRVLTARLAAAQAALGRSGAEIQRTV